MVYQSLEYEYLDASKPLSLQSASKTNNDLQIKYLKANECFRYFKKINTKTFYIADNLSIKFTSFQNDSLCTHQPLQLQKNFKYFCFRLSETYGIEATVLAQQTSLKFI